MKKLAIACASLSLMNAASAESGVLLYGVVDTPIEYVNHVGAGTPSVDPVTGAVVRNTGGSRVGLQNNSGLSGSRWGLRGTEELSGGWKAIFALESGFGPADGTSDNGSRLFGRQAFVGLVLPELGTISFGRQYTSLTTIFGNFSALAYANLYEPLYAELGLNFREDNTVKYSGTFGGFTAEAHYSFGAGAGSLGVNPLPFNGAGEVPGHHRDNSAYGGGVTYTNGKFGVALAYDQWNPALSPGQSGTARKAGAALSYTNGPTLFMLGYRWGRDADADGTTLMQDNYFWFGASYQVSAPLQLSLAYFYDDVRRVRTLPSTAVSNPKNPWQLTLVADYSLSKRTDVYLTTAYVKNSALNFDTSSVAFVNGYSMPPGYSSQFGAAVGIRHKF